MFLPIGEHVQVRDEDEEHKKLQIADQHIKHHVSPRLPQDALRRLRLGLAMREQRRLQLRLGYAPLCDAKIRLV